EYLEKRLEKSGRRRWVAEEMRVLLNPETYVVEPDLAWRRVKTRTQSGKFLALVRELARFRELFAQERNIPRNRVFKDDALLELASTKPQSHADLGRSRLLLREARRGDIADGILAAVASGLEVPKEEQPQPGDNRDGLQVNPALADMLRVLLKAKAEEAGVAQKLIATAPDLDALAAGERDGLALTGWRREVFGNDALRLCDGEVGLAVRGDKVGVIDL
ncbi:MAG: HRDC domain-containing protein, partial [Pseudomonadota bacterium]